MHYLSWHKTLSRNVGSTHKRESENTAILATIHVTSQSPWQSIDPGNTRQWRIQDTQNMTRSCLVSGLGGLFFGWFGVFFSGGEWVSCGFFSRRWIFFFFWKLPVVLVPPLPPWALNLKSDWYMCVLSASISVSVSWAGSLRWQLPLLRLVCAIGVCFGFHICLTMKR